MDSSLLVTSHQDKSLSNGVSLFRMPGQRIEEIEGSGKDGNGWTGELVDLDFLKSIEKTGAEKRDPSYTRSVQWSTLGDHLITAKSSTISVHDVGEGGSNGDVSNSLDFRLDPSFEISKTNNRTTPRGEGSTILVRYGTLLMLSLLWGTTLWIKCLRIWEETGP